MAELGTLLRGRRVSYYTKKGNSKKRLLMAVFLPLIVIVLIIASTGHNPLDVLKTMYEANFASSYTISELLLASTPLILIALGYSISFRVSWYIGSEGAYVLGAAASTASAIYITANLPGIVAIPLCLLSGAIAGGAYALIIALAKVYRKASEVVTSIMLSLVAIEFVTYLYSGPMRGGNGGFAKSQIIPQNSWLPTIADTRLHYGFILAIALTIIIRLALAHTIFAFRVDASAKNQRAAKTNGINVNKVTIKAIFVSGFLAGTAGAVNLLGLSHGLAPGVEKGYGSIGILVAWLAGFDPLVIIPATFGIVFFTKGAEYLQFSFGISGYIGSIIAYVALLAIVATGTVDKE